MKLAAVLTCHNRKALTLECLKSLFHAVPWVDVYLTDDASTDGTSSAIRAEFPQVRILSGDGQLYWNRGMYKAWTEALSGDYDYYLWLNDDQTVREGFLDEMLQCMEIQGGDCIVSGLVGDAEGVVIYGGYDRTKHLVQESERPQSIFMLTGNIVLVPRTVVNRIGILDPFFQHDLGDVDYGLTAIGNGISVVSTRKIVGLGNFNAPCRIRLWGATIAQRFKKLNTPLGSPVAQNFYFRRKHFGLLHALAYCSFVLIINLLPDWAVERLWGQTYVDHSLHKPQL